MESAPIIGIDLGTTNSCIGVWRDGKVEIIPNSLGHRTTPSWVAFKGSQTIVGELARRHAATDPRNTIFDVKRLMGRRFCEIEQDLENYQYNIVQDGHGGPLIQLESGQTYKPEEISAMILAYLKETAEQFLGQKVTRAVITVPAYFNDSQRQATKNAAIIAGLECQRIVNEPTAACLCYGLEKSSNDLNVLVFDLGGGTFDVSVLNLDKGVFQVLATNGNTHLGGEDFDWALTRFVDRDRNSHSEFRNQNRDPVHQKRLQLACEQAKRELSSMLETQINVDNIDVTITRKQFEKLIEPFVEQCLEPVKQVLKDADLEREKIDEIVLVGGSTRIPIIRERLSLFFNNKRLNHSVNPDEAVAYGATVQAAILSDKSENSKVQDLVLLDVTPLSLGIETTGGLMARIIERNTNIPCQQSKMFSTSEDNQTTVLIQVFEGERKFTCDNQPLGTFELGPIPEAPRMVPKIKVTFKIDSNGILQVSAIDQNTGLETVADLTRESGRLSAKEIQDMIQKADNYRVQDEVRHARLEAVTGFERSLFNIQQAVNDANLNNKLTPDEISFVNQYVINSFQWLNENRDEADKSTIEQAQQSVEYNLKPFIQRLYSN